MATITITIADVDLARVKSAMIASAGLDPATGTIKQALADHIVHTVHNVERANAQQTALVAVTDPAAVSVS